MTLVNSGNPISMGGSTSGQSINLELGQSATTQISLNDTNARALAGITTPGAQISLYDFYGKSSTIYPSSAVAYGTGANLVSEANMINSNDSDYGTFSTDVGTSPYVIFSFGAIGASKTLKLYMNLSVWAQDVGYGDIYLDCGAGPYETPGVYHGSAQLSIDVATNGTNWANLAQFGAGFGVNESFTTTWKNYSVGAGSDVKVRLSFTNSPYTWQYDDPTCANISLGATYGTGSTDIYTVKME